MKFNRQDSGFTRHRIAHAAACALVPAGLLLAAAPVALAAPQGGQVRAGQAAISQSGALTTVQQGSARAVIDWRSFSVGAAETVRFDQPSSSAWVLNRVVGNDASAVLGRISANGQVMLINPNGIVFGRGAQVDVASLVAATADVSTGDFMAGRLRFGTPGKPGAKVDNQGRITVADGGLVALVGHQVANSGVINARLGKVALAAGDAFTLDLYGDRLINLIIDPAVLGELRDSAGVPLAARVDQQGSILAERGVVQISAATVQRLVDNIINVGGTIRAASFESAGGVISLRGDSGTRLSLAGTLDVSGTQGGRVEMSAGVVRLADGARVDASGTAGGGSVAIGGGWQGAGELPHARSVSVARGAVIDAGATVAGSGGTVSLWSDGDMRFDGRVNARGGAVAGDGGQVEVSGRDRLGFAGEVDAGAA
ncbi:filamentous hemagglutinin N-terminal domain-containing protein, partial [Pelomonas sp. KK5]|uniref:two-partner secretion domain-containing protein n=1 Tax=Pelomonas sp. KK5 TaxID=1855730 RepID=UPI00117CA757